MQPRPQPGLPSNASAVSGILFLNFLATHDCRPEFREFRNASSSIARSRRTASADFLPNRALGTRPPRNRSERVAS
jgi:hypothetical protein